MLRDFSRRRLELVLADLLPGTLVRDAFLTAGFAAFTGVLAQVSLRLAFTPVPIMGPTLAVLLRGMALWVPRAAAGMAV